MLQGLCVIPTLDSPRTSLSHMTTLNQSLWPDWWRGALIDQEQVMGQSYTPDVLQKNGHNKCPFNIHALRVGFSHTELGRGARFSQWDNSKCDSSRDLVQACAFGLPLLAAQQSEKVARRKLAAQDTQVWMEVGIWIRKKGKSEEMEEGREALYRYQSAVVLKGS